MFKYSFKLFFRNILKNKSHFSLNLLGLTTGIACFLFALLFVLHEYSYDNYHANKDRIARMTTQVISGGNETNVAYSNGFLTAQMPKEFPEIASMARFMKFDGRIAVKYGQRDDKLALDNVYYADPTVFSIFGYHLAAGNPTTSLAEPNSIVLTKRIAQKIFGDKPALNEVIQLNGKPVKVTGVMDDLPGNSDLSFQGLISIKSVSTDAASGWVYTYVLFRSASAMLSFQPKLDAYAKNVVNRQIGADATTSISYHLQPLTSIHFSNNLQYDTPKGNKVYVNIFLAMGILVLFIALTNSMNMTVVNSFSRNIEIGIQKIYGASRSQLLVQQTIESAMLGLLAMLLGFYVVSIFLPQYATIVDRVLALSDLLNWKVISLAILAVLVLTASGTAYTGIYLKQIRLADTLRSRSNKVHRLRFVPKAMLGFQLFISIGMIIAAFSVYRQVRYFKEAPLGFNPLNVLVIDLPQGDDAASGNKLLKNALAGDPNINLTSFCSATALPGSDVDVDVMTYKEHGIHVKKTINHIDVDANYFTLLQIPVIKGSSFRDIRDSTARNNAIVTDLFARTAGWSNPVGETIVGGDRNTKVVGVVPEFHFNSLHKSDAPLVIFQEPETPAYLLVRVPANKLGIAKEDIAKNWKKAFPNLPFYYRFLDQHLEQQYQNESNLLNLMLTLASLIAAISCMGLIAYVSFVIRIARLDIAVRRIIGATFRDIFSLFAKQYLAMLTISFVFACPVAWYSCHQWLQQFSYHVAPKFSDFLISLGIIAATIAGVVLFFTIQCIKMNPAKIIREK